MILYMRMDPTNFFTFASLDTPNASEIMCPCQKSSSSICVDQLDKCDEMQDMLPETFEISPTSSSVNMDTSCDGLTCSNQHNRGFDK
ncbi:hypothetical protein H5410_060938 [Solanum commersonii]|uniref:Uncharacterized protein n=1 Tax=Solanum commersonii TaxID=4109 RepID=A0A9J5W7H0_SOLCO|nr:hypothetical protein H5410_060938 [Solanum commersonii]